MRNTLVALAIGLSGCIVHSIQLDAKFAPLTSVEEPKDASLVIAPGMVTTIYSTSYTASVASLTAAYPVGSVEWDALFFHEQVHAQRELENPAFLFEYAVDSDFRWSEERLGYAVEIRYLLAHGLQPDLNAYATVLSTAYQGMVSYDVALAWLKTLSP